MNIFSSYPLSAPLNGTTLNNNLDLLESSLLDLGPYVISGLVPSAGAGLTVSVTAGVASIGGRVTVGAPFNITGLTPSALNHLYLLVNGTGTANTSGIAPANSAKLGTATTGVATVSSVDTTPTSGRQTKVDLTALVTTGANLFTAQQTFLLNDGVATVSRPLVLQHSNSGGVGAIGIGVGLELQIETATEGLKEPAARIDATASAVTAGAVTGSLVLSVPNAGTMAAVATVSPAGLTLTVDDAVAAVTRPLTLQHGQASGAGAANIGVGIDFQVETATGGTYQSAARINAVATTATAGAVTGRLDLNVPNAGTMGTVLALAPTQAALAAALIGNGTPTTFGGQTVTMGNANYTLLSTEYPYMFLQVNSSVNLTAQRDLIVPHAVTGVWVIYNNTGGGQAIRVIGSSGTGIVIANARQAACYSNGTNIRRWGADLDPTV